MKIGTFTKFEILDKTFDQLKLLEFLNRFKFRESKSEKTTGFVTEANIEKNNFDLINSFSDNRKLAVFRFRIDTKKVNAELLKSKVAQEIKGIKLSASKKKEVKNNIKEELLKEVSASIKTVKILLSFETYSLYILNNSESIIEMILEYFKNSDIQMNFVPVSKQEFEASEVKNFQTSFFPEYNYDFLYYLLFQTYNKESSCLYLNRKIKFTKYDKNIIIKKETGIEFDEIKKFIYNNYKGLEAEFILNDEIVFTWNCKKNYFAGIKSKTVENKENDDFGNEILMVLEIEQILEAFKILKEEYLKTKKFTEEFKNLKIEK